MDKGARGAGGEMLFLRRHLYASRVEEYGKGDIQRKFGEVAVDIHKYKRQRSSISGRF